MNTCAIAMDVTLIIATGMTLYRVMTATIAYVKIATIMSQSNCATAARMGFVIRASQIAMNATKIAAKTAWHPSI